MEAAPKKRGHKSKSKEEREQYLQDQVEKEANLPLYEKKMEAQLDVPLEVLRAEVPMNPKCGAKKMQMVKMNFGLATEGTSQLAHQANIFCSLYFLLAA